MTSNGTIGRTGLSRGDIAILGSNLLWGTFWIPLRQMTAAAGGESEATLWGYAAGGLIMIPIAIWQWRKIAQLPRLTVFAVILLAACMALYSESLTRGQVARVLLLFYLTPIWSMIFARFLLNEPITFARVIAICLGLSGAVVMLGLDGGMPLPRNQAEWMGLTGGVMWALASTWFNLAERRNPGRPNETGQLALVSFLLPLAIFLTTLIPGETAEAIPFSAPPGSALIWTVAFGAIWVLPVMWLTFYGANRIDPSRLGIFLLLDVAIGAGTAAILTDEPFGLAEALGALLIVSAAFTEALGDRTRVNPG